MLSLHLGTGSNQERFIKGPMGRRKTTTPSSLSLTSKGLKYFILFHSMSIELHPTFWDMRLLAVSEIIKTLG